MEVPSYLRDYESIYKEDPKMAALQWFKGAKYGLCIHYGLYSLLGKGEWVMYRDKIPVAEYGLLKEQFCASQFDAEKIAEFAVQCGMKYITLVTCHYDMFCLWDTKETSFQSMNSPAHRDFVQEFVSACEKRGLGLFLYYSYGLSWRHPYSYDFDTTGIEFAKPLYDFTEPTFLYKEPDDFDRYIEFANHQIRELLTNYGPIAGICFDLISPVYKRPEFYNVSSTYDMIRSIQPQCLISYKQGLTGEEDYMSLNSEYMPLSIILKEIKVADSVIEWSDRIWSLHKHKHNEIYDKMQTNSWGYMKQDKHKTVEEVLQLVRVAKEKNCNLLMNIGPLPDGSIHAEDEKVLLQVGEILRKEEIQFTVEGK